MANTDNNTIALAVSRYSKYVELLASAIIYPGELLRRVPSDTFDLEVGTGVARPLVVAIENRKAGKSMGIAYGIGDRVYARVLLPGDEVLLWLATGETTAIGDRLYRADNGQTTTTGSVIVNGSAVATALEVVTSTGSGARIRAEARRYTNA